MAAPSPKVSYHVRSNSLPSKPHPLVTEVDEHLYRLRSSEDCTPSSSSICQKLSSLQELYDCLDKLLLLPLTQQDLAHERNKKWVDEVLEGSLNLLDLCSVAKEALLQTKESTDQLQSVLRRRRGEEMEIANEAKKCLASRKIVKKAVQKALKAVENKLSGRILLDLPTVSTLGEAKAATLNVVEALLSFIAGSKLSSRFSSFSKLVRSKKFGCDVEEESNRSEFEMLDAALHFIICQKATRSDYAMQVKNLRNKLEKFESSVEDLKERLEGLYRRLIKTRVFLLNIFNH